MPDPSPTTTTTTTDIAPTQVQTTTAVKPGARTSEFYLTLLTMILGALMASGVLFGHNLALQIVGGAMTVLAKLGYVYSRTVIKTAAMLCLISFGLRTTTGCSWTKSEAQVVKTAAVDCTKGELGTAVKTFSPMLDQLLVLATGGDGHLDTGLLENGTRQLAGDIGKCVLTASIAKALNPPAPAPGAPQSSPLVIDPGDLHAFYAAKVGGQTYVTEYGTP